jgi:PST family polysaccharide transporter
MSLIKHHFFKSKDFKLLAGNITNFSSFQITNYLVPLLTIPYIVRVIGAEKFGIITFAQSVIQFLFIVVDYGYNISAITKISKSGISADEKKRVFNGVFFSRILLMVFSIIALLLGALFWNEISDNLIIYIFSFLIIPAQILTNSWIFSGLEQVKYLNYINFLGRMIYLLLIFLTIQIADDYYLIPGINALSMMVTGVLSFYIIKKVFKIQISLPSASTIIYFLKDGWTISCANFSINLYRNTNIFILGLLVSKEIVGIYAAGEKFIKVLQNIFNPITQTVYPFITRIKSESIEKSIKGIKILAIFSGIVTLIISTCTLIFSEQITVLFLGDKFSESKIIIEITAYILFFGILNYIIGIIFMLNFGMKENFTRAVILTGIFNLISCFFLTFYWAEKGTAISFILSEIFLFIYLMLQIFVNRRRIIA